MEFDYMYLKSNGAMTTHEDEANIWAKTLTGVDLTTKTPYCAALTAEISEDYVVASIVTWIDGLGHVGKIKIVSDGEPQLVALMTKVKAKRTTETLCLTTPVASGASIGTLASMQDKLAGQARTLKSDLEHRYGLEISAGHAIWPWLVRHCAWIISRYDVGSDGRTS